MGTEDRNPRSLALDHMGATEIVSLMNEEEHAVLEAVEAASESVVAAAKAVADVYRAGGHTFILGAGTSGRLAVMEAAELPPTFGVADDRFVPMIASGPAGGPAAVTRFEDDVHAGPEALAARHCGPGDAVIGLAASGTTPFVVAGMRHADAAGAWTCGISNNAPAPLLSVAQVGIFLDTGPEVITGSTRLKAGTSQKLALNRITTTAMVLCGKVISNLMVEVTPSNDKLRQRSIRIVSMLSEIDAAQAAGRLEAADWCVRRAVDPNPKEHM